MKKLLLTQLWIILFLLPLTVSAETADFVFNDDIALNMVRGEIQAPIETTRFQIGGAMGELKVDLDDLAKTRGTIKIDLLNIQSYSFADSDKNSKQTEHMLNWFEIGPDVDAKTREKNRWAVFEIKKITKADPANMKAGKPFTDEIGTGHFFNITAEGPLTVHGIKSNKTIELAVSLWDVKPEGKRYKQAKRVLLMRTVKPIEVSMKQHDIKPRDATGQFLSKALSVVGLKIADQVLISLDLRAVQIKSQQ